MKSTFLKIGRVLPLVLLLIGIARPCATHGSQLTQPHGTLVAQLGWPSPPPLGTGWVAIPAPPGMALNVNIGATLGLTFASVTMDGSGILNYSQYPGNGSLSFANTSGTASMNIGFQTFANYQISYAGNTTTGNLPLLPNLDFRFADQQSFGSYMLGQVITLSDSADNIPIISAGTSDFNVPSEVVDLSLGVNLTPTLQCRLSGVSLQTSAGTFYSASDILNVNLNSPSVTISGISQTTHCSYTALLSPNFTIEASILGLDVFDQSYSLGQPITIPLPSTDISTTPSQSVTFNLSGSTTAPIISTVSPGTLIGLPIGQTQLIRIIGSGFTGSSTLTFNDGVDAPFTGRVPTFINANELDYSISVGTNQANWSVQVVNGSQTSALGYFTVNAPSQSPSGSLLVNLSPAGAVSAGAQWQVDGGSYYSSGGVVPVLTPGSHTVSFKSISGYTTPANQIVNITANVQTTASASYAAVTPSTYTLTLNYNNTQGGASASPLVSGNIYNAGAAVQIYASASSGYHFTGWGGDASGTNNPTTITMNGNKNVTANFASGDPNMGTVIITIQPPAAATAGVTWGFNVNDFRASGSSYTTWPETYILSLHTVDGWLGPPTVVATVTAGQTTNITVNFTQDTTPGLLTVTLSPPDAVTAGAKWHINGGAAQGNGATVSLAAGTYTLTYDSVPGWTAPASQSVTVSRAQTTVVTGNYTPPAGQPVIGSISPPIGSLSGGSLMTISGANFTAPATVLIGGQPAANVSVSSATQITCSTPSSTTNGTVSVIVQTTGGSATNLNGFAYGLALGNKVSLVSAIGGSCFGIAVQGNYAYVGEGRNFLVLDVTTPSSPSKVGRLTLPGIIRGIALLNQYAYVADEEGGVQVVDISSPTTPKYAGFYSTTNQPWSAGIAIYGGRAYVADEVAGLQIFDLGNPIAPALLSTTNIGSGEAIIVKASVNGVFAYVSTGGTLSIVDVSNPLAPALRGQTSIGGSTYSIAMSGNYVYAASLYGNLEIVDVSNTNAPSDIGHASGVFEPSAVASAGGFIYAASESGQHTLSIYSPSGSTLTLLGQTTTTTPSYGYNLIVSGTKAYVAGGSSGVEIVDVSSPSAPSLLTSFTDSGVFRQYNSAAITGNSLAACGYPEGTIVGFNTILDVSNPSSPSLAANPTFGGLSVLAKNGLAYVLNGNSNFVFNVSTPSSPQLLKLFANTLVPAINMELVGNVLYLVGQNGSARPGFTAIGVSTPTSPVVSGTKDFTEYSSGSIATSVAVIGNRALVGIQPNSGSNQVVVLDISNVASPVELGTYTLPFSPRRIQMSSDGNYGYVCGGGSPTLLYVINISQPATPLLVSNIIIDSSLVTDLEINGNELFATTYRGLYVYDISSPSSPVLTRSFTVLSQAQSIAFGDTVNQAGYLYLTTQDGGIVILREQDIQAPDIYITDPIFGAIWTNTTSTLNLGGGSDDNVGVTAVTWANSRGGSGFVAAPFDSWYVSGIKLYPGTNIITATAFDAAGNSGKDVLTVIYPSTNQNQTITFPAIANHSFGDPAIMLNAAASSGLPVAFTVISGPAVLSGSNLLTLTGSGAVTIEADQSGNSGFNAATPIDESFNVAKANQSIAFAPVPNHSASDAPFALTATASSGLAAYFNILSGPATVSNNIVTLLGGGTVTVIASQPGNSNYNAAATLQQSFTVSKIPQTITFGALSQQKAGDASFPLTATVNSGLSVNFSVSGPAMLNGNIVTVTGSGNVTVVASQPGNSIYAAAANVTQSFFVSPPDNTLVGLGFQNNNGFQMAFYGMVGSNYVVQASSNLLNWQPFTNFIITGSPYNFSDAAATNFNRRFYRALKQ